jgi:hypothetical protein
VRALNRAVVLGRLLQLWFGVEGTARSEPHLYHSVRAFLRRRHRIAGSGYRQFPAQRLFGEPGVVSFDSSSRRPTARASMRIPSESRMTEMVSSGFDERGRETERWASRRERLRRTLLASTSP